MSRQQAVLPLLTDYLSPPLGSFTLVTGTLGATPSWLILHYLATALHGKVSEPTSVAHITLASWLHNSAFWREASRKLPINFQKINVLERLNETLSDSLDDLGDSIVSSVSSTTLATSTTLMLDNVDFLLASTSYSCHEIIGLLSRLRQAFGRLIVTVQADGSFLHVQNTPLEVAQAALVVSLAHQADTVIGLRALETGSAKDVSGVLRVTQGGQGKVVREKECLYHIGSDGLARVFEKGT